VTRLIFPLISSAIFAIYTPFCGPFEVKATMPASEAERRMPELWSAPADVAKQDMVYGPWGRANAPDATKPFIFAHEKTHGASPGLEAKDDEGRQWSVKYGDEGHVEVVLSRVLSAVGYHQPPVYYVSHFKITDKKGTHDQGGARFRPKLKELKDRGEWAWQQNPFVGTRPYQGLLVILMLFDSTDLKNSNNTLYEYKHKDEGAEQWYVVRDLGSALGETGRLDPKRNDPDLFERNAFISKVHDPFVEFSYHGYHQELYSERISRDDVQWACDLVGKITEPQWRDLFASAGYEPEVSERFIAAIEKRIDQGRRIGTVANAR
jgi:hypothetical protein